MRLPEEPDLPLQINLVPMIDVIFALLAFFILSSLFLTRLEGLPVNLPQAGTGQRQDATAPTVVTLDAKGNISLNGKPIKIDSLTQSMRNLVAVSGNQVVIVNADEKVPHGKVVAVMDSLRQVQGVRLAIATEKP
ncbi:MAG: biopolymer transporter ExbD [Cyanobacteria bacterium P01_A01_bin.45]